MMIAGDDNRTSQLNSLKNRLAADLAKDTRPLPRGTAPRTLSDERAPRLGNPLQAWHHEADYDSAFRLLQMASEAIDVLHDRCRRLETDAREMADRLKSEGESSERVIKDWERLATALKSQLTNSDAALVDIQTKLEAAENRAAALEALAHSTEERALSIDARAAAAEARAEVAEQRAAREGEAAATLRDTIIQTFGVGTRLSSALAGDTGHQP